jgi:hypothetical protein
MSRNRCDGCVLYFKLRAPKAWHILAPICRFLITRNVLPRSRTQRSKKSLTANSLARQRTQKDVGAGLKPGRVRDHRALRGEKVLRRMVRP